MKKDVTSGMTVRIPPGVYIVDNNGFNLSDKNDITIEGFGAVLVPPADWSGKGGAMFTFTGCRGITIRGLTVRRNTSHFNGRAMQGIAFIGCGMLHVEDCRFFDCYDGITIKNSTAWKVVRNSFVGTAHSTQKEAGYQVSSHGLAVYDIHGESSSPHGEFSGNYGYLVGNLIYGQGADYCRVIGNSVHNSFDSALYLRAKGGIIANNVIVKAGKDGIKNINPEGQKTVISNNVVDVTGLNRKDGGCGVNTVGDNIVINSNQITLGSRKSSVVSAGNYGVCFGGNNYSITGNVITGPGYADGQSAGVALFWSSYAGKGQSNIVISGNAFSAIFAGAVIPADPVRVLSSAMIVNNTGKDMGLMVSAGDNARVSNLVHIVIKDNAGNFSQRGVTLKGINRFFLTGNVFTMDSPSYYVVDVAGCADSEIRDNHVVNAKSVGVAYRVTNSKNIAWRNNYHDSRLFDPDGHAGGGPQR